MVFSSRFFVVCALVVLSSVAGRGLVAADTTPFKWSASFKSGKAVVDVVVPRRHYLYAGMVKVVCKQGGKVLAPVESPKSTLHKSDYGDQDIYPAGKAEWVFKYDANGPKCVVDVKFQGCRESGGDGMATCFMPSSVSFESPPRSGGAKGAGTPEKAAGKNSVGEVASDVAGQSSGKGSKGIQAMLDGYTVVKVGGGYMPPTEFLGFLDVSGVKDGGVSGGLDVVAGKSWLGLLLFVFIGGLALNLTPCVLPMIPVNLAIIGAGSEAGSKGDGFFKGTVYGLGIALAYGVLGVASVMVGAKFGALNSMAWFNFAIAVVFLVLALAMFDVIPIDFSKYGAKLKLDPRKGGFVAIFALGVLAALLAGACVAPVLIAVLLHSATIYAEGNPAGLLLPFLLGAGMASPWPLVGAGMAVFPKPGAWMVRVKQVFGVLIVLMAAYYAYLGFSLSGTQDVGKGGDAIAALRKGLLESERLGKPVFIDFWASWCKNCLQMERTTFRDFKVKERLNDFVVVKFQAERPSEPEIAAVMDRFKLIGLPGYVILRSKKVDGP